MDYLRKKRKEKGLTQSQLAELTGLTFSAISRIEQGDREPRISTIRVLAKALDFDPDEWIDYLLERRKKHD